MLLYAVIPADASPLEVRGLAGHRLETIRTAYAAVIVEEHPDRPGTTRDESFAFAKIICDLATATPMLPIRFPTVLPTASAVLAELQAHGAEWQRRLIELAGLSEVVIRAQPPKADHEADSASRSSGTSYLVSRAAAMQQRDTSIAEIGELVRDWAREIKVLRSQQGVRIACLVSDADVPQIRHAVEDWQQARDGREAVVSGPWPPFSFVEPQEALSA
jgi:gas vesicle protein GvpL/GvpF